MPQKVLKSVVILTLMLHALFAMEQPQTLAHDITPSVEPSNASALSTLVPEQAQRLLASIEVLNLPAQDAKHVNVKSAAP